MTVFFFFLFVDDCEIIKAFLKTFLILSQYESISTLSIFARRCRRKFQVINTKFWEGLCPSPIWHKISNAQVVRYLKLVIVRKLSLDEHCLRVVNELSRPIDFIFKNFKTHNVEFLWRLHFICCKLKLIASTQAQFTRRLCATRSSYTSYVDRLEQSKLDTLENEDLQVL